MVSSNAGLKGVRVVARGHFKMLKNTEIGLAASSNPPFRFARTPREVSSPASCPGGHTEYVCSEILGMSDEESVDLLQKHVFE